MKRLLLALLLAWALPAQAQLWSSILDDSRGADWASAGVTGGIPTNRTQCGSTIAAYTGTAATINNAIAACGTNQYVLLGAGTFVLSGGVTFAGKSNVTLRGAGANQTTLDINGSVSCNGFSTSICVSAGYLEANDATPGDVTANWTAGYAKGTTVITLSSVSSLAAGDLIYLLQDDDASDPGVGQEFACSITGTCANGDHGGSGCTTACSPRRGQGEWGIVAGISGSDVTLQDPILANNWRSGQNPKAAWKTAAPISGVGVEDLAVEHCSGCRGIEFMYARDSWVKGVKSDTPGRNHVDLFECAHCSVVDSYFYEGQSHSSQSYGVECLMGSRNLVQNNISTNVTAAFMWSGSCPGSVLAYNYSKDATYTTVGWQQIDHYYHGNASSHNLHEGNIGIGLISDNVHGPSYHITAFRNYFRGRDDNCAGSACTSQTNPIHIYSQSRFFNLVGNVLGDNAYHNKYESYTGSTSNCYTSVLQMDFSGNACNTVTYPSDSSVRTGTMRWGNYDVVGDTTRWCGNSSNTGWSTTCSSTSEVPTAITGNYDNAVPSTETLPNSFYLSAKPAWFGSRTWPGIGPDVTGGDLSGLGGHVHTNPAKACYDAGTFSGAEMTNFNAATCYAAASGPSAPTGLRVIGQR